MTWLWKATAMMNREKIKMLLKSSMWAMRTESLEAVFDFIHSDAQLDAELFHAEKDKATVSAYLGDEIDGSMYSYRKGRIGVMMIDGPIIPRATMFSDISGVMSIDRMSDEFKALQRDARIDRIVLAMDTPGGSVTGISDFAALVAGSEKPVSVFAWSAASAGYWIASAADEIISPEGGMVGSIGVVSTYVDYSEADSKKGVRVTEIVSSQSPYKRAKPDSETGRAVAQQLVDDLADSFIGAVAEGRGVEVEKVVSDFGGGAMFASKRALDAGMIDGIQDFESFVSKRSNAGSLNSVGFARKGMMNMSEEKRVEAHADGQAQQAEAVDFAKQERERIQSIESLASDFAGSHPSTLSAVKGKLDELKYDPDMTKEKAAVALLAVVSKAEGGLIAELEKHKADVNKAAAIASQASSESVDNSEDQARKAKVAAGAKIFQEARK
jgi:capsid assembly protease